MNTSQLSSFSAQIPGMSHPFHLHGNAFYVIGQGCGSEFNITKIDVDIAKELDLDGKIFRHLVRPASKDTYAVPNNGFTVIRMVANNPGNDFFKQLIIFPDEIHDQ